jgi:hypothetical protein
LPNPGLGRVRENVDRRDSGGVASLIASSEIDPTSGESAAERA